MERSSLLETAEELWHAAPWARARRRGGARRDARGLLVVPLYAGRRLAALLYVDVGRQGADSSLDQWAELAAVVARTVAASLERRDGRAAPPEGPSWDHFIAATPPLELERRRLRVLLKQHEWNVARVARELRVTRATVYSRMRRCGILRRRVRKTT